MSLKRTLSPLLFLILIGFQPKINGFAFNPVPVPTDSITLSIENCVNSFNLGNIDSTKAGYQYWFVAKDFLDGRTLKLSCINPGLASHPPHQHDEDEFFFVIEGEAEFFLNGARRVVGPMTSLYCPPNSEHGIRNAGTSQLKYLVIKKYNK
ncbi:MAG: cupin domain-containing protein [Ignavibacteriales bacterium]|nr:cupin domain-containing protein [Ignavibacteriales bacterium]